MKYCPNCGHANSDDAIFCVVDGSRLGESDVDVQNDKSGKLVCDKCGFENSIEMKYCGKCGNILKQKIQTRSTSGGVRSFMILFSLLALIILGIIIATQTNPELFDDVTELFEDKKDYYFKVHMRHSSEIDKDGETINLSIDTNIENLDMNKLHFKVDNVAWWSIRSGDYAYPNPTSSAAKYAKKPIVNVELVNDKNFKMTVDRNSGYRRRFVVEVTVPSSFDYSSFLIEQNGYKEWE